MGSVSLGTIKKVPIQQVWPREAGDFTPWLASNLNHLSEKLGMELSLVGTEAAVGDFSADIEATDLSTGRTVVIENQFWQTDHKHLGQILTYAAGRGANAVIWVAETIRPEHRIAIDLLIRGMKSVLRFYAVEVSVVQIDDSRPAVKLEVICEPEESEPSIGNQMSGRAQMYQAFFQGLIDELHNIQFTNARKAQPQNWYTFSSEKSDVFTYAVSFARSKKVRTEIYIDCGIGDSNKQIFDALFAERTAIESSMGFELTWERLDAKRASRVAIYRPGSVDAPAEELDEIKNWAIANLKSFKRVLPPRVEAAWQAVEITLPGEDTI
jgi:hypothetical protein